jgi:putative zinc finger protein
MDHSEVNRLMASEKYLLDELSSDEMEAFEQHLFECEECATDVRAGAVFLDHAKVELAAPVSEPRSIPVSARPSGRFAWWQPAFALPVVAVLLIVIGYQNLVTYPALKTALAENGIPKILPAASLISGAVRGATPSSLEVQAGGRFFLPLDIPAQTNVQSYRVELHNPAGVVEWSLPVSAETARNTLTIDAPGVKTAGRYEIVVLGVTGPGAKAFEVGRYPFELQFAKAANPEP